MINQSIAIGLISSLVIEFLKLFPFLSATDNRKRALAFTISLLFAGLYLGTTQQFTLSNAFSMSIAVISMAIASYKLIIQPIKNLRIKD